MYQIRKKFKFEAAHMLTNAYSKECMNVHGHSYIVEIFLRKEILNNEGMIFDFKKLKEIVKSVIDSWDHALIIESVIYNEVPKEQLKNLGKIVCFPCNPTAENMAGILYNEVKRQIGSTLYKVRIHETETGYAEYWEK